MARRLRLQYAGAIYHVMNRGDRREDIFLEEQDRLCFVENLGRACENGAERRETAEELGVGSWKYLSNVLARSRAGPGQGELAL